MSAKPPFFKNIKSIYAAMHANPYPLFHCALPLLVLAVAVKASMLYVIWDITGDVHANPREIATDKFMAYWPVMLLWIPYFVYSIKAAIGWHRTFIQGGGAALAHPQLTLDVTERAFLYKVLLYALLWIGICMLPIAVVAVTSFGIAGVVAGKNLAAILVVVAIIIVASFAFSALSLRFTLYFPAKASGDYVSFRQSFRLMRGLGMKMLFMILMAGLPVYIFQGLVYGALKLIGLPSLLTFAGALSFVFIDSFFSPLIAVAVLSHYYIWIRDNRMAQQA